jgi:hypothetical protein
VIGERDPKGRGPLYSAGELKKWRISLPEKLSTCRWPKPTLAISLSVISRQQTSRTGNSQGTSARFRNAHVPTKA